MNQNDIFEQRKALYMPSSAGRNFLLLCCIAVGVVTFIMGMATGNQVRTWGGFLLNLMLFFSISLGGVAFGSMQDVIGAVWGRPIKRLHETFSAFLPYAIILFFVFFFCLRTENLQANKVYRWVADAHLLHDFPGKNVWLTLDFMIIRDVLALLIIGWLSRWHIKQTLQRDLLLIDGKKEESFKVGMQSQEKLRYWSAPILVVYALCFTLLTFDLTMSLAPTWFSTLWGGWSFAIMMQTLMAFILLFMFALRGSNLGSFFKQEQYHDVGKLMHGFTVFFAYLTYSHVLTYWYTNIPEETSYFLTRMQAPWINYLIAAPFLSFLFPFIMLIFKSSKWTSWLTVPIAIIVIISQWLSYFLIVTPEVAAVKIWDFPWIELGIFIGFAGFFVAVICHFGKKVPMVSIADPLLLPSLNQGH